MNRQAAHKVTEYIYQRYLGRAPDADGLASCVRYLMKGGDIEQLESQIRQSPEYTARSQAHPLHDYPHVFTATHASYYTHRGLFRPLSIQIETVNICNNDCIFCPYSIQSRKRETMSLETFRLALSQYEEIGGGQVGLTPMVGEVFLDKLLPQRLDLLSTSPWVEHVSAITNASTLERLSDEYLDSVLQKLVALNVSVYGLDPDEYRQITRRDGYDGMLEGAVRLLRIGGPDKVILNTRQLIQRDPEFLNTWLAAIAQRAGIPASRLRFTHSMTTYANWSVFDTSQPLPHDAEWTTRRPTEGQCALPLASMQVYSNGNVSICSCMDYDGDGELVLGNVHTTTLKQILQSERYRQLWRWSECGVPKFCQTCTAYRPMSIFAEAPAAIRDPLGVFNGFHRPS